MGLEALYRVLSSVGKGQILRDEGANAGLHGNMDTLA